MAESWEGRSAQRMFVYLGTAFLLFGPVEVVIFFQLVPGFALDIRDNVPGPLWFKQFFGLLTSPAGAILLAWGLRGIYDLELSDDSLLLPLSSPSGLLHRTRRTIPFRDIVEVRFTHGRRGGIMEVDIRKPNGGTRSRLFEMSWVADPATFRKTLGERVHVTVNAPAARREVKKGS